MRRLLILLAIVMASAPVFAETTTGGVTFTDSLGYTKPAFIAITVPTEASAANKYYVSLSSGSGTTCSQASPCTLTTVSGKTGVSDGGGAYIYIKGTGAFGDPALRGSSGSEVVFKPWPAGTTGCTTECTAIISDRNNWTANKQYVIFDGGPNLNIQFVNSGANQFDPSIYFNATATQHHDITFYRTRWRVTTTGEWIASFGGWSNLAFLNSEFDSLGATDSGNQHHMYLSGCNGSVSLTGLRIRGNVFRDTPGESIELRAAGSGTTMSDVLIDGNAFHDIGKGTCSTSWKCRSAVTIVEDGTGCAGTTAGSISTPFQISNNLIWDVGEGCLRPWDMPAAALIVSNTCINWGAGPTNNGLYTSAAFANFSFTSAVSGDYRDNIIYATGNDPGGNTKTPFPNNASVDSFNACRTGVSCGTSSQNNLSAASFVSLNENDADFLKLAPTATPIDTGTSIASVTTDYFACSRSGTYDIGAQEVGATGCSGIPDAPPTSRFRLRIRGALDSLVWPMAPRADAWLGTAGTTGTYGRGARANRGRRRHPMPTRWQVRRG